MADNGRQKDLKECYLQVANINFAITFMSAFESSPVHCLNLRPSAKRQSLGNRGDAAILLNDDEKE